MSATIPVYHAISGQLVRKGRGTVTPPPPPPSGSRFPGDPGNNTLAAAGARRWLWGIDENDYDPKTIGSTDYVAPEVMSGGVPCGIQRLYYTSWSALSPTTGAAATQGKAQLQNGRIPWTSISVQSNGQTWKQAADGRNHTTWYNWISYVEEQSIGPHWLTFQHECDAGTKADLTPGSGNTPADFASMSVAFRSVMDEYANNHGGVATYKWKNLAFGPILTDWGWSRTDGKDIDSFQTLPDGSTIPRRTYDFMGVDTYVGLNTTNPDPPYWTVSWQRVLNWAEDPAHTYPLAIGEYGVKRAYADAGTKIQQFYDRNLDGTHDVVACCYYTATNNPSQPKANMLWLLVDDNNAQMATTYVNLMKDSRSIHYYDLGYAKPAGIP